MTKEGKHQRKLPTADATSIAGTILLDAAKDVVMHADAPFLERNGYLVSVEHWYALKKAVKLVESLIDNRT